MFIADIVFPQAGFDPPRQREDCYQSTRSTSKPPRLDSFLKLDINCALIILCVLTILFTRTKPIPSIKNYIPGIFFSKIATLYFTSPRIKIRFVESSGKPNLKVFSHDQSRLSSFAPNKEYFILLKWSILFLLFFKLNAQYNVFECSFIFFKNCKVIHLFKTELISVSEFEAL